jgi:hypothetical protein
MITIIVQVVVAVLGALHIVNIRAVVMGATLSL